MDTTKNQEAPEDSAIPSGKDSEDDDAGAIVFRGRTPGKSVSPFYSKLALGLAAKALDIIGRDDFCISANIPEGHPDSIRNFHLLQSILKMAFNEGVLHEKGARANPEGSRREIFEDEADECNDALLTHVSNQTL